VGGLLVLDQVKNRSDKARNRTGVPAFRVDERASDESIMGTVHQGVTVEQEEFFFFGHGKGDWLSMSRKDREKRDEYAQDSRDMLIGKKSSVGVPLRFCPSPPTSLLLAATVLANFSTSSFKPPIRLFLQNQFQMDLFDLTRQGELDRIKNPDRKRLVTIWWSCCVH